MSTTRVYNNTKRMSTGVTLKDGTFLQVYPTKQPFQSETLWRESWSKKLVGALLFEVTAPSGVKNVQPLVTLPVESKPKETPKKITKPRNWKFERVATKRDIPPGKYYVGDICYALDDKVYDRVFGGEDYESGCYTCEDGFFMVANTAYGDGSYKGTNGKEYAVDAGVIGIVSEKLIDHDSGSLCGGHIHTFKYPIHVSFKGGIFKFDSQAHTFTIDTVGRDDDYYEDSE
jgi:hypothetical protein